MASRGSRRKAPAKMPSRLRSRFSGWLPWTLAAVVVLVVAFGVWSVYQAFRVNQELSAAVDDAAALQAAVTAGDDAGVDAALADLQDNSGSADDRTSGFAWSVLTVVPVFGDDAQGLRTVSSVVHDLSTDGLAPALRSSRDLDRLLPTDGAVDLAGLERLRGPLTTAADALDEADRRLAEEDPSGFIDRLRTRYEDLQAQVSTADSALGSAATAIDVLPAMLGADDTARTLLVFQNNAEIRATGGLPGAITQVDATDGRLEIARQAAGSQFPADQTALPLTPAEQAIYGDVLGTTFVNANNTPDFPRAADLMRAHWEQEFGAEGDAEIDNVVTVDAVALSYVLAATGPIEVDGIGLSSENVVQELLNGTYLRLEDPAAQDAFFNDVASTAFTTFTTGGVGDPQALVRALGRAADEGRLQIHSFDDAVQGELDGTLVAGELVVDPDAPPQLDVTLDDATGGKMSYYLRADLEVTSAFCTGDQTLRGALTLTSTAPDDAASLPRYVTGGDAFGTPPGDQLVVVRLYGPVGGDFDDLVIEGRDQALINSRIDDRSVQTPVIQLAPGQSTQITWTVATGDGQDGDAQVTLTPTLDSGDTRTTITSSC